MRPSRAPRSLVRGRAGTRSVSSCDHSKTGHDAQCRQNGSKWELRYSHKNPAWQLDGLSVVLLFVGPKTLKPVSDNCEASKQALSAPLWLGIRQCLG